MIACTRDRGNGLERIVWHKTSEVLPDEYADVVAAYGNCPGTFRMAWRVGYRWIWPNVSCACQDAPDYWTYVVSPWEAKP